MNCEPMFDVMMMTVFLKSTVRPWPSVMRPSSSTCSSTLNTSWCAFSISSKRTTLIRLAPDGLAQLAAFLVADIAGRRADQTRDGVFLHVFAHVDADHGVLVVEQKFRERARQLRFADAGRAEENERADRAILILQTGASAPDGIRNRDDGFVLADDALHQALFHFHQLLALAFLQARNRDVRPA